MKESNYPSHAMLVAMAHFEMQQSPRTYQMLSQALQDSHYADLLCPLFDAFMRRHSQAIRQISGMFAWEDGINQKLYQDWLRRSRSGYDEDGNPQEIP